VVACGLCNFEQDGDPFCACKPMSVDPGPAWPIGFAAAFRV
jgi:hypothetical protein